MYYDCMTAGDAFKPEEHSEATIPVVKCPLAYLLVA